MDINDLTPPEEDYDLQEFFPKRIPYNIVPLIEFRVKLLSKDNTIFHGGEIKVINTCCMLNGKLKGIKLSMFLIPIENTPLDFQSRGYISNNYKGRVLVKLANYSVNSIRLHSGTPIAYIVLTPYSLDN